MTRFYLVLFFILVILSSCSMARLDRFPGIKQDSIPVAFQGNYYLKMKPASKDPDDSIWVGIYKDRWSYSGDKKNVSHQLSDNYVFSRVNKYFVLSMRDETSPKYWNSWVVMPKKKNLELYPIVSINEPGADKLSRYLNRKFDAVLNRDSVFYYELNDESFTKFFEKEIKGSKTFEIIRIKDKSK
jgi:hypothetical protein